MEFFFVTASGWNITLFNSAEVTEKKSGQFAAIRKNASFYGFDESIYFKAIEVVFNYVKCNDI